jgi:hypothetical protein
VVKASSRFHNASPSSCPTKEEAIKTAAKANHLSCWRSTPLARRYRTTSESAEMPIAAKSAATTATVTAVITPPTCSGLSNKRMRAKSVPPEMAAIHDKGRQRREGSRPEGNSSNRKGAKASASGPPSPSTLEIVRGAGSDPGSTTSA